VKELLRDRPTVRQFGGGGEPTRFICGYLACDPLLCRPILAALPRVLTVSLRDGEKSDWLERSFVYAVAQATSVEPGGEGVLAKLSEVLFVETLRRYVAQISDGQTGWLAGLRDRIVGRCLALMHEQLASNLLRRSSLSMMRIAMEVGYETDTAFSRAFRREFGVPPAAWRRENSPRVMGAAQ
jgi:hypothetical protein